MNRQLPHATYDPEAHALYVKLRDLPVRKTTHPHQEWPGDELPVVLIDYSEDGQVVGVEVLLCCCSRGAPDTP